MSYQKNNISQFNQYMNSDKMPYIIYADLESLITKIDKHIPCRYPISTIWGFDNIETKHSLYRGEDFLKRFSSSLREYATNAVDFENLKCQKSYS